MDILEAIKQIICSLGYGGIFAATTLEYGCCPISSEILLPFIGYMAAQNGQQLFLCILVATLGGILGSFFCYFIGRAGGNLLHRFTGRFETIALGLDRAEGIFRHYGKASVFFARVFPIARTYISFPAGLAGMSPLSFCIYTGLGAFLWNTALISGGYFLGNHWDACKLFFEGKEWIFFILPLGIVLSFFLKKKKRGEKE